MQEPEFEFQRQTYAKAYAIWVILQVRVPLKVLFFIIRVLYYIGNLKRDPTLKNYPHAILDQRHKSLKTYILLKPKAID